MKEPMAERRGAGGDVFGSFPLEACGRQGDGCRPWGSSQRAPALWDIRCLTVRRPATHALGSDEQNAWTAKSGVIGKGMACVRLPPELEFL